MAKEVVSFIVNGNSYELSIEPNMTLIQVLRDEIGLTGTKHSCGVGACGACTVLIDGRAVLSCLTLAIDAKGKNIITIEGLTEGAILHPIQQSFVDLGAIQCGFCTPGMILSAQSLLDENPHPTREEVRVALSGNLCRCTGYMKIFDAVLAAADNEEGVKLAMSGDLSAVGKRLPRKDSMAKATGTAEYAGDMKLPGMLIGKVLRSPYPHARILSINKSRAEKLSGVEAVVTVEDAIITPTSFDIGVVKLPKEALRRPHRYIFNDKVRYVGEPVAAVAAINQSVAEKALELIEVKYQELPAVFDPVDAMEPSAPLIHNRNIARKVPYNFPEGDVKLGFEQADLVLEDTFGTTRQVHCCLEPMTIIANFDINGRLTIWSPAQAPHIGRREIAHIFSMSQSMVRLISPFVGGAFGSKIWISAEPICVLLAKKTGKPVKLELTKEEDFITMENRTAFKYSAKLGFKNDGTLTAVQLKAIVDAGGYSSGAVPPAAWFMDSGMGHLRCANRAGEANVVYTNTVITGAMRGMGNPEAMWGINQLVDLAAEKLGLDPLELHLKNAKKAGELTNGLPIQSTALDECIKLGAEKICWYAKRATKNSGARRRGVGMATMSLPSGGYPALEYSNAFIKLNDDGSAILIAHPVEMGTGISDVLTQIAAEELGLFAQDVHLSSGDTDVTMFDVGSYASRSVYMIGNAVLRAAREAKVKLLERAAKTLNVPIGELEVKNKRVCIKANPEMGVSIAEVVYEATYNFTGKCEAMIGKGSFVPNSISPTTAACFAETEVNIETGEVSIIRIVAAVDCGRAINPTNVEGQIEGGIVQAIGFALTENNVVDKKTGIPMSRDFEDYKILSALDVPDIEVILVERPDPAGPFGAKGVGEAGFIAVAPAIANAVYNAVGVRINDLPMTPDKILKALKDKRGQEAIQV